MTSNTTSCNLSPLSAYVPTPTNPWDAQKVRHLHNRIGFGIKPSELSRALILSPEAYVDTLIDEILTLPPTQGPAWADLDPADYPANGFTYDEDQNNIYAEEAQYAFIRELLDHGTRGRLTLFWHNILVTRAVEYRFAGYAFRYFQALERNCVGNFKDFISEIGLNEAMLKFLNGFENTAGSPNENYARELYELFTLGEGNGYTEDDIVETSRALTGFTEFANGDESRIIFNEETFDSDSKTIFGQTGNWGYNDVINILFEQKAQLIARYICERIYVDFVSPKVDEQVKDMIINPLADVMIANDFELAPVFRTLFKSAHFFDEKARNVIIKSPLDLIIQFMNSTGMDFGDYELNKETIKNVSRLFDQDILNPPTVAGWDGNRDWINSGTITFRGAFLSSELLAWAWEIDQEQFRMFAINVSGYSDDAEAVARSIFEALMVEAPYTLDDFEAGVDIFKSRVPSNYFETNTWTLNIEVAPLQVRDLIEYIVSLPDYQLK